MEVILERVTDKPAEIIIKACRTCYQSFDKQNEVSDENLLRHVIKNNESVLEFANFTFSIEGISRVVSHQLVRNRIGFSYAQQSQRFVEENNFDYIIPNSIKENEKALEIYNKFMNLSKECYKELRDLDIKKEDARFVLPNATETKLMLNANLRSLRHFLNLRLSKKSQWEIRELANKIKDILYNIEPLFVLFLDNK